MSTLYDRIASVEPAIYSGKEVVLILSSGQALNGEIVKYTEESVTLKYAKMIRINSGKALLGFGTKRKTIPLSRVIDFYVDGAEGMSSQQWMAEWGDSHCNHQAQGVPRSVTEETRKFPVISIESTKTLSTGARQVKVLCPWCYEYHYHGVTRKHEHEDIGHRVAPCGYEYYVVSTSEVRYSAHV